MLAALGLPMVYVEHFQYVVLSSCSVAIALKLRLILLLSSWCIICFCLYCQFLGVVSAVIVKYWQFSLFLSFSRFFGRSLFFVGCSRVGVAFIVAFGYAPSSLASDKHSLVKMITFMSEIK